MSPAVCAAIAQVAPVFMVLLVAERVVFTADDSPDRGSRLAAISIALGRIVVDFGLALLGAALTIMCLIGIEEGGYAGRGADTMWMLTTVLIAAVLARWLLLSTPLLLIFEWAARAFTDVLSLAGDAFSRVLSGIPLVIARFVLGVAEGFVQFTFGVLSIGTLGRSTSRNSARRRRRHRGPRH